MILQVRGTSGSGKTTVMRQLMERLGVWEAYYIPGKKRPLFYQSAFANKEKWPRCVVLGHYESPCGGCDTIGSARQVYELAQSFSQGETILMEGLLLSEDSKWTPMFRDKHEVKVFFLTTSLERCLAQIKGRRQEVGNEKELNVTNTSRRVAVIERARVKLIDTGVTCRRVTPEQCVDVMVAILKRSMYCEKQLVVVQ